MMITIKTITIIAAQKPALKISPIISQDVRVIASAKKHIHK